MENRFEREEWLIGADAVEKLKNARVALFGVGGVGSYAAEALARSGVGYIELIDNDTVSVTNINRQLCALTSTVGRPKVEVVSERIKDINPSATVVPRREFFLPETKDTFDFSKYDFVIDAIDTVSGKLAIVECCHTVGTPVISCMGTGNKLDPTAFKVTDISKTSVCPLARVMRRELKKRGITHLKVVYSEEIAKKSVGVGENGKPLPASIAFVPPIAGLIAASEAVKTIIGCDGYKKEN
ncbi:MAG: tRNA threonylcarbamoyladenosine dehydratase [Clostridia bacterium]|nr:tRNA threonylcarbamoyladenosine dehydratase [Clostridia bacterium]